MNQRKAKLLRRVAGRLSVKKSTLTWNHLGCRVYPETSYRRIYQLLKKEARDPEVYERVQIADGLHMTSLAAAKASKALKNMTKKTRQLLETARSLSRPLEADQEQPFYLQPHSHSGSS